MQLQLSIESESKNFRYLRHFSKILVVSVSLLIFIGSLVTSHGAGLAVPDWPTTFGQNMFLFPYSRWKGLVFFEHFHRVIASVIGCLTVILAIWASLSNVSRAVKFLCWIALLMVITQGVLGGLTVLYLLPDAVSVSHAVLAQTFFVVTIIIAFSLSYGWRSEIVSAQGYKLRKIIVPLAILVYLQLILGALMRHTDSGLAVPDFPLFGGGFIPLLTDQRIVDINNIRASIGLPPVDLFQVWIHSLHRLLAVIIIVAGVFLGLHMRNAIDLPIRLKRSVHIAMGLLTVQFSLGVVTVLTVKDPFIASFHVVTGALLLGSLVIAAAHLYTVSSTAKNQIN